VILCFKFLINDKVMVCKSVVQLSQKGYFYEIYFTRQKTTVSLTSAMLNMTQNSLIKLGIANGHCGSKVHLLHYKVKFFT